MLCSWACMEVVPCSCSCSVQRARAGVSRTFEPGARLAVIRVVWHLPLGVISQRINPGRRLWSTLLAICAPWSLAVHTIRQQQTNDSTRASCKSLQRLRLNCRAVRRCATPCAYRRCGCKASADQTGGAFLSAHPPWARPTPSPAPPCRSTTAAAGRRAPAARAASRPARQQPPAGLAPLLASAAVMVDSQQMAPPSSRSRRVAASRARERAQSVSLT